MWIWNVEGIPRIVVIVRMKDGKFYFRLTKNLRPVLLRHEVRIARALRDPKSGNAVDEQSDQQEPASRFPNQR